MKEYKEIYAVDFDGTLCRGRKYPEIGEPNCFLIEFLKETRKEGDIVILWTCRTGQELDEAVRWCSKHGLEFDFINENTEESKMYFGGDSRKIYANYYIDDKNMGVWEFWDCNV